LLTSSQLGTVPTLVVVLRGRAAVLSQAELLEQLAERCGQAAAMSWLPYFLDKRIFGGKIPYLVLMLASEEQPEGLRVEDVRAAVLVFEYSVLGVPTGVYSTDDAAGFRTVICAPGDRCQAAKLAAEAILRGGAQIAMLSYDNRSAQPVPARFRTGFEVLLAQRRRPVAKMLVLESSYAATVAKLGRSTRFNLGYYRRRLEKEVGVEFVADARGLLTEAELEAVNAGSLNPIAMAEFRLQYRSSTELRGGFVMGLRTRGGQWLSLIGGWRQAGTTVLHWQMNAAGHERLSIGTAFRSYFLEEEIRQGTRYLMFYGGTPHSIQNSFAREQVTDLMVQRRSWRAAGLCMLAKLFASPQWYNRRANFLASSLWDGEMVWRLSGAAETPAENTTPEGAWRMAHRLRDRLQTGRSETAR
jgi:hypothetical protein